MKTFQQIQREIGEWARQQFKANLGQDTEAAHYGQCLSEICSLYGVVSELGELAAVDVRAMQGRNKIATESGRKEAREDALGDLLVFLCDYAYRRDIDLHAALDKVWAKVCLRRRATWEADKARECPPDAAGNFGAGCEEGHHEWELLAASGNLIQVCRKCKIVNNRG